MSIGDDIRHARKAANMTQQQLAEKMGTTPQMISAWENGARNPKYSTQKQIEEALGQPLVSIYAEGSDVDLLGNKQGENKDPVELAAAYTLTKLNHTGLVRALAMLEDLAKVPEYQIGQ